MTARVLNGFRSGLGWMACLALLAPGTASSFVIPGHPDDGEIRGDTDTVNIVSEEISIGHRGADGTELATAIYLFELPDLAAADINNATLQFTFLDRSGSFAANPANADIWGLGYVSTPTLDTRWHLLGDSDSRTGNDLGTGINANPVVRLADDFLDSNSNDPTDDPYRMTVPSRELADFIGMLYDEGAAGGDYAVIRVNVDAATSTANRGFDIASANATTEATRPVLTINENTVLVFDPFTDGDRTNGEDPLDTDWYKSTGSLNLTVEEDSAGIGDGNALKVEMLNTGREFLAGFPPITIADPGDFIQLTCTFRPSLVLGADEAFRMGFFTSGGAPLRGDTSSTSDVNHYNGYVVRMSTTLAYGDLSTVWVPQFLGGSPQDFLTRHPEPFSILEDTTYRLVYTISRTSSTQVTTRVQLNGVVLNGMDPGTDPDPLDWAFLDTFDAIGMGVGNSNDAVDFTLDNVLVETSVSLLEIVPHTRMQAEVIEMEVETQPNVRYSLQGATDLGIENWTATGYILTGDGGTLRIYDPAPPEAAKSYRMQNQ